MPIVTSPPVTTMELDHYGNPIGVESVVAISKVSLLLSSKN